MMTPDPCASIAGRSAWSRRTAESRLASKDLPPGIVVKGEHATGCGGRATDDVDQDVHATETGERGGGDGRRAAGGTHIGLN